VKITSLARKTMRALIPSRGLELARRLLERLDPFVVLAFSQEGEDMIIHRKASGLDRGFYVDVGAHHPIRFSNTMAFYRKGWRGINIDANPDVIDLFERARPNDINICAGVANSTGELTFHIFDEPAVNTFDRQTADELTRSSTYRLLERRTIRMRRLADVLEDKLPKGQGIDLMSIDVEGLDLDVMRSNDWEKFRARWLLVEARGFDLSRPDGDPLHQFAESSGYGLIGKTVNTLIYEDARHA
jgi:FkbM family methyltransferase